MKRRINRRKYSLKGTIEKYEYMKYFEKAGYLFFSVGVKNLRERSKDVIADLIISKFELHKGNPVKVEIYKKKVWTKKELGV